MVNKCMKQANKRVQEYLPFDNQWSFILTKLIKLFDKDHKGNTKFAIFAA